MESKLSNSVIKDKLMITTLSKATKTPKSLEKKYKNLKGTKITERNSKISFPKLCHTMISTDDNNIFKHYKTTTTFKKIKKPKKEIELKKLKSFINPVIKSELEKKSLRTIRDNLIKKRFIELHKYKLKINPKNYYNNYGLNNFIIINNNNKKNYSFDYHFNNVSSYNNIQLKEEEKIIMDNNKKIFYKNIKIFNYKNNLNLLKNNPFRINNNNNNEHIIKSFNKEKRLTNNNPLWRGKNRNDIIHNKTNLNFYNNFIKNTKSYVKIKIDELQN